MLYPNDDEFQKSFGRRVRFLRKKRGYSQLELAGRAELEKSAIQRIERGCNSTLNTIRKLANALNIELSELCDIHNNT